MTAPDSVATAPAADAAPAPAAAPAQRPLGEILPLTGMRIIAALWVVFFHIRGNLNAEFPEITGWFWPILQHGDLGVDLFFALSGFVLTLNYVDRMGTRMERPRIGSFVWARLARVWPVYFVTLNIAALWHGALLAAHSHDPVPAEPFSVLSYLRQFTMVVLWTEPDSDRLTWNGPAWSVSAEWLVYLLFPLLALLLLRVDKVLRSRQLLILGALALLPAVLFAMVTHSLYFPYEWLLRLLGSFAAGCLACLAARRLRRTHRTEVVGAVSVVLLTAAMVLVLYGSVWLHHEQLSALVIFLFAPLLLALSVSKLGVAKLLSTKAFVRGGHISYSVYLVHMLMIEPLWWSQTEWPRAMGPGKPLFETLLLSMPVLACVGGYLMWRCVEEPARRKMRAMTKVVSASQLARREPVRVPSDPARVDWSHAESTTNHQADATQVVGAPTR